MAKNLTGRVLGIGISAVDNTTTVLLRTARIYEKLTITPGIPSMAWCCK